MLATLTPQISTSTTIVNKQWMMAGQGYHGQTLR